MTEEQGAATRESATRERSMGETHSVSGPTTVDRGTLRLALTVGGLVLALLGGFAVGRFADASMATRANLGSDDGGEHSQPPGTGAHQHGAASNATTPDVGGLAVSVAGYRLTLETARFPVGRSQDLRFQVRNVEGRPVTRFAVVHEKPMHLILNRRDLSGYQHLHPTMSSDGTWIMPLTLPEAGSWRVYADFTAIDATGRATAGTLGVDLLAAGDYQPRELPPAARSATVDGLTVSFEGNPQVGASVPVRFQAVADGGAAVRLEPYLGAYGHLVALREGDLGYLHVHPESGTETMTFWLTAPSAGRYRLFLDFKVAGVVRTVEFTLVVS